MTRVGQSSGVGRGGVWIGALIAALVVALAAMVLAPLVTDDGERSAPSITQSTDSTDAQTRTCAFEVRGRPAQMDTSNVNCWAAEAVYGDYQAGLKREAAAASSEQRRHAAWLAPFVGRPFERVGPWRCLTFSYTGYPLLAECKTAHSHFTIRGVGGSAAPYFTPTRGDSPAGRAIEADRYFASKSKWRRYPRRHQLEAARVFIRHTPAACERASAQAMVTSLNTRWLAGRNPRADQAYLAMFEYCYEATGGNPNRSHPAL
jgi:hypothetical protein